MLFYSIARAFRISRVRAALFDLGRQSLTVVYCSAPSFLEDYFHGNISHKTARLVHSVVQGSRFFRLLS